MPDLIAYHDVPATARTLASFRPPSGVQYRVVLNPTPRGVEVQARLKGPGTDTFIFRVTTPPTSATMERLKEEAFTILLSSASSASVN